MFFLLLENSLAGTMGYLIIVSWSWFGSKETYFAIFISQMKKAIINTTPLLLSVLTQRTFCSSPAQIRSTHIMKGTRTCLLHHPLDTSIDIQHIKRNERINDSCTIITTSMISFHPPFHPSSHPTSHPSSTSQSTPPQLTRPQRPKNKFRNKFQNSHDHLKNSRL